MNKQAGQFSLEALRLVPTERIPDRLFVCSAKIELKAGIALKNAFEVGVGLPKDLEATYNEHLVYAYDLGEKGSYWEAGPSVDFTEILYIFATNSLEEAQKLMHQDPFYEGGVFYDDWWFEWAIHSPYWKVNLPHRAMIERGMSREHRVEIQVDIITPPKLVASLAKQDTEYQAKLDRARETGEPFPAFYMEHNFYRVGPGGTGRMGYDWGGGPSVDYRYELSIFSVNSMQMAQFLRENDPFAQHGFFYDIRYFEWCIHMPLRKASPTHKEALKRFLRGAGVKLAE